MEQIKSYATYSLLICSVLKFKKHWGSTHAKISLGTHKDYSVQVSHFNLIGLDQRLIDRVIAHWLNWKIAVTKIMADELTKQMLTKNS